MIFFSFPHMTLGTHGKVPLPVGKAVSHKMLPHVFISYVKKCTTKTKKQFSYQWCRKTLVYKIMVLNCVNSKEIRHTCLSRHFEILYYF